MKSWRFMMGVAVFAAALGIWGTWNKKALLSEPLLVSDRVGASNAGPRVLVSARGEVNSVGLATDIVEATQKLQILNQILESRDDNDPRLDREFNGLSAEVKRVFRERYQQLPLEKRNERGTIVYLLGRNLKTSEDYAFFQEVLSEAPCLSLSDCSKETHHDRESHRELGVDVTLAYPQMVALRQIQRQFEIKALEGGQLRDALKCIQTAKGSKIPAVVQAAAEQEQRLNLSGT